MDKPTPLQRHINIATDPVGHRVGYGPSTTNDVFEIPEASYVRDFPIAYDDGSGPSIGETNGVKTFCVPSPVGGTYQVLLTGTGAGSYTLDMSTYWFGAGGQPTQTTTGTADVGITSTNYFFVKAPPVITQRALVNNVFTLTFTSQPGVTYNLGGRSSLTTTNWTVLQSVTATGTTTTMNQAVTGPSMFYRVIVQ